MQTPSTGLRRPSSAGGRRKARLGVCAELSLPEMRGHPDITELPLCVISLLVKDKSQH